MRDIYLQNQASKKNLIDDAPDPGLEIVVIIPCFDEPNLTECLHSLILSQKSGEIKIEVIIIVNYPENADAAIILRSEQLIKQVEELKQQIKPGFPIFTYTAVFPERKAGVGLARKTGMDEATRRFAELDRQGIIVNLDADCTVASDYLYKIARYFEDNPRIWAAGVQFEHRTGPGMERALKEAIIEYELHLRYFIAAQRHIGLPFAYQTVGSCMTVRSTAYEKMGGMNVRQAGEDFYFLHKFIDINRFGEINSTTVYPAARASHRVPFGTGRAVAARLEGESQKTYSWLSFQSLEAMVKTLPELYKTTMMSEWINALPEVLSKYLLDIDAATKLDEIRRETNRYETFYSRFFQWFNAFRLMKYLHAVRPYFPDQPVVLQAGQLVKKMKPGYVYNSAEDLLRTYRDLARNVKR